MKNKKRFHNTIQEIFDHQAYFNFFEYLDSSSKKVMAKYITSYPIDLSEVRLTYDELEEISAPLSGLQLYRFTVPIPNSIVNLKAYGIRITKLPKQLKRLTLVDAFLEDCEYPVNTIQYISLTNTFTDMEIPNCEHNHKLDELILSKVEFNCDSNLKVNSEIVRIENTHLESMEINARKVELSNSMEIYHNPMEPLNYTTPIINCEELHLYSVCGTSMRNVNCSRFVATRSVIDRFPNNAKIVDIAETYVSNFSPLDTVENFLYTGEYSVDFEFPENIKNIRVNNFTMRTTIV